ncbi:hypothetical protein BJ170DRAFT_688311 [Xylariales sp. AK1849]|nr:hypothetical protein BJ170DRAFT_688311 [Xylariales sp. AK1849]
MSWMDSWSRPSKSQATPAPFYLLPGGEATPYCHSCGRVIGSRRTAKLNAKASDAPKYCSSRCRSQKPGKLDREIEGAFVSFLMGEGDGPGLGKDGERGGEGGKEVRAAAGGGAAAAAKKGKKMKGDPRVLVACGMVEASVFGHDDAEKDDRSVRSAGSVEPEVEHEEDAADDDPSPEDVLTGSVNPASNAEKHIDGDVLARMSVRSGTRIRPPQSVSQVNGSVGGEKGRAERTEETEEMLEKRRQGQRKAKEREMVRCAARRGVTFGFALGAGHAGEGGGAGARRLCEAVMAGKVVEPSFAKGDWGVRWRE